MASGRQVIGTTGEPISVLANMNLVQWCAVALTIDWNTVTALAAQATYPNGDIYPAGKKVLRYGQILTKITNTAVDVVTISGSPTGGTFTITVTTVAGGAATTSALAYNAAAATVQTALRALANVGGTNATVSGSAGGPYTITFVEALGAVTVSASGALLTGGSSPAATNVATSPGGDTGMYGPYDPAAVDGRQTLTLGSCFILNHTLAEQSVLFAGSPVDTDHVGGFDGGLVFQSRVIQSGVATHTLAVGPTLAEFVAAFPRIRFVPNS